MKITISIISFIIITLSTLGQSKQKIPSSIPLSLKFQQLFNQTELTDTKIAPRDSLWISQPTFLLKNLKGFRAEQKGFQEDKFGGISDGQFKSTGFFYTTQVKNRWWIIDPDGHKWYCKGLVSISPNNSMRGKQALQDSFKSLSNWALKTSAYAKSLNFNTAGAWSSIDQTGFKERDRLVYTPVLDIISSFGQYKKVSSQGVGHASFKNGIMPVFDPEFQEFAEKYVYKKVKDIKNDPWLLGYFSDNELNFANDAINRFLKLPESDANYIAVNAWANTNRIDKSKITKEDQQKFLEYYVEQYYKIASGAIRKADPNHLFLSSRLHGGDKNRPVIFNVAGKYCDVISFNYYRSWYPEEGVTKMWEQQSGKPFMITEWYAKAMDSGMTNESGYGWVVKTQEDRGRYYENFALGLLADKNCVGWQYFKYQDNDPTGKADPSNIDGNKGLVTWDFKTYQQLVKSILPINKQAYSLILYFDQNL